MGISKVHTFYTVNIKRETEKGYSYKGKFSYIHQVAPLQDIMRFTDRYYHFGLNGERIFLFKVRVTV